MKNIFFICGFLALISCAGAYKTSSGGKEDVGLLSIVGDPKKYQAGVMVSIDNNQPQIVEVVEEGKLSKVERRIKAPTGKHTVKVMYQNKVVYSQSLLISLQETKKISLP